ncbi:thioredoxin family protein [Guggenheimella bovis]
MKKLLLLMLSLLLLAMPAFAEGIQNLKEPKEALTGEKLILFARDTCPDCVRMKPLLENVLKKHPSLEIYRYDTDAFREHTDKGEVFEKIKVEEVPTLLRVKDGVVVSRLVAVNGVENLTEQEIDSYLSNEEENDFLKQSFRGGYLLLALLTVALFIYALHLKTTEDPFTYGFLTVLAVIISAFVSYHREVESFMFSRRGLTLFESPAFFQYALLGLNIFTILILLWKRFGKKRASN